MISTLGGTTPPLPGAGLLARPLPELVLDPAPSSGSSLPLSSSLSPISDFATPTQAFAHRRACRSRHQRSIQPSAILTAVDTWYLVDIWYLSVSVLYSVFTMINMNVTNIQIQTFTIRLEQWLQGSSFPVSSQNKITGLLYSSRKDQMNRKGIKIEN